MNVTWKSPYLKILWESISGVMIFAFPRYLDFQATFWMVLDNKIVDFEIVVTFVCS